MMNAGKKKRRRRSCVLNLYNNNNEQLYPLGYIEEEEEKGAVCIITNALRAIGPTVFSLSKVSC